MGVASIASRDFRSEMASLADRKNASPAARTFASDDTFSEVVSESPVSAASPTVGPPLASAAAQSSRHATAAATSDRRQLRCLGVASSACDSSARTAKTSACTTSAP